MALQLGQNSFATVSEANTYFSDRVNADAWNTSPQTAEALVTATGILDELTFNGTSSSFTNESFKLAFPRNISFIDAKSGSVQTLTDDRTDVSFGTIPSDIKTATFELAFHLINNADLLTFTTTVRDLTVGAVRLINVQKPSTLPSTVYKLIEKYIGSGLNDRGVKVGNIGV